ncbi:MAG: hypothetical protein PHP79_08160, partial [Clostridia bacterium]|nr:hypothetical protein [Clostridia bacterium]
GLNVCDGFLYIINEFFLVLIVMIEILKPGNDQAIQHKQLKYSRIQGMIYLRQMAILDFFECKFARIKISTEIKFL